MLTEEIDVRVYYLVIQLDLADGREISGTRLFASYA